MVLVRFLIALLFSSMIFSTSYGQDSECLGYLSGSDVLDLTTSSSLNFNLNKVTDIDSFRKFIVQFSKSFEAYSLKDKNRFVITALYEIEKMSVLYFPDLDIYHEDVLVRLFTRVRHYRLESKFILAFQSAILKKASSYKDRNIASLVYLFGRLRVRPSPEVIKAFETMFIEKADTFLPQNLSNIIFGFSLVGVQPSFEFLEAWRNRYKAIHSEFLPLNIANSLYSFYLMGSAENVKWFVRATPEARWGEIKNKSERRQISQVFEYYNTVHNYVLRPIIRFKGQFRDLVEAPDSNSSSEFEETVEMGLAMSGRDYEKEFKTTPGFYVDFYIPELNRIIQVDGPSHYIREFVNGVWVETQRPQDLLIDEVLSKYGYEVKRRNYKQLTK